MMVMGNRQAELALRDVLERSGAPEGVRPAGRSMPVWLKDPGLWAGLSPLLMLALLLVVAVVA